MAQLALQKLDLTICAKRYISVPSRGSCDLGRDKIVAAGDDSTPLRLEIKL